MPRLSKIGAACLAAFGWTTGGAAAVTGTYLTVAGGGGGSGGGGGAGGLLTGTTSLDGTLTYTVTVGAGGAGTAHYGSGVNATNGGNSQFGTTTAAVGGGGAGYGALTPNAGSSGGSGGGAGYNGSVTSTVSGGAGTSGQGNAGGSSAGIAGSPCGGGGGAGAVGQNGTVANQSGNGGVGLTSSISGTSTYYAGGGAGWTGSSNSGGLGGGASGVASGTGNSGLNGFGGGGGGTGSGTGGTGGSGVVIVSYPAPQIFWGGFVTTSGGNIIHTFTTSGSLAPIAATVTANYLVLAGGAGGGSGNYAGGGGAGGFLASTTSLSLSSSYTVTVGAGGAAGNYTSGGTGIGGNGGNSVLGAIATSTGGGGGGGGDATGNNGQNGGSGGGGAGVGNYSGGTGVSGQGNAGANGTSNNTGGGGGGSSAAGSSKNGGNGTASSISGASVTYAGGGAAFAASGGGTAGTGGAGAVDTSATISSGSGGGANGGGGAGKGGSGVVIISYAGSTQLFGGGVVTFAGGNTIHTFNTSGTLTPVVSLSANYLIVAGGGGGLGGGGGAGGFVSGSGITIDTNSTYLVTVGSGGASGVNGSNSSFSSVPTVAIGGGRAAGTGTFSNGQAGTAGGSGGAGFQYSSGGSYAGGAGTSGQGNAGGAAFSQAGGNGGGGGGAGAAGANAASDQGGNGGNGLQSSITGTATYYAGGGGGSSNVGQGTGGLGGGGAGAYASGIDGTANTGGGGGGGQAVYNASGGSGIVIISYAGSTQLMAGGTVTITGGNVIHTFTSSGYLSPLRLIGNSLRFRASNTAYLSRTPTVASNRQKFTWSGWVKRGSLGTEQPLFQAGTWAYNTQISIITFGSGDNFVFASGVYGTSTENNTFSTQVFRDPAAWYHLVVAVDTTQATASDRVKMYVNGVQITAFTQQGSYNIYPTQNYSYSINNTVLHTIGDHPAGSYFDGYQAETRFIDGQQLTPNSFGTFNSYGVWQPITYGGSYGTNGFYLPFNPGSTSYAGSFNGSSQYLSVAQNSAFNLAGGNWTIECWFNWNGSTSDYRIIFSKRTGGTCSYQAYLNLSTGIIHFYNGTTVTSTGVTPTANVWNHLACVQNSSNITIYLNGVAIYTFANTTTDITSPFYIGYSSSASEIFSGSISNFRLVKGTAVYTSTFTPSTTPLTNISGTSLLTLQNATIVDNSTNAFTITNTGTVVTSVQTPFIANAFSDQGPAGNNWTANNIGQLYGSTYDSMTDVPTLTSATAANYCVINPLDTGGATLSNGNLTQTTPSTGYGAMRSTLAVSSGKWYWEVTPSSLTGGSQVGIAGVTDTYSSSTQLYQLASSYTYWANALKGNNNSATSYGATYAANDVIGVALDLDGGTITFYKNNTSQGTAFTGLSGTFTPAICDNSNSSASAFNVNYGQQPFVYTPPSGFVALNTYNL